MEQWVDELLYLDHGINPPKKLLETLSHTFNIRDADSATLNSLLESDDDEAIEMEDSAFTHADTARNDNPDYNANSRFLGYRQSLSKIDKPCLKVVDKLCLRFSAAACNFRS